MGRIYLVEDDPDVHELLLLVLGAEGHQVESSRNGAGAAARAGFFRAELLVLDVSLPGIDGLGVAREARQIPALRDVPILMLTARAREEDVGAGLDAGATEYVVKPFDVDELLATVSRLLARQD